IKSLAQNSIDFKFCQKENSKNNNPKLQNMEIYKTYQTKEVRFTMKLNKLASGNVEIPLYAKISPDIKFRRKLTFKNMSAGISEKDFNADMEILVPQSLGDDWAEACFKQLQIRLKMHYNQYGRIMPADLECFIGEMIIVMSEIG